MQFAQMSPHAGIFRSLLLGVLVEDVVGYVTSELYELSVTRDVGNMEVERHTALLCTLEIAWSTEAEVGFGNLEAIGGLAHDVDALASLLREIVLRDEDTIALIGSTPHATTELVKLR